ncbi:hypothetical protein LOK49_LG04G00274 [Camellia lanceoleosa]|uniref:Uncharacterized protein n=1 Tax=Camellia lanceoleosa TaxID=1840588 RepID=A0ACC0I0G7_9ERIC|nr:hypothetical protein LOK49_LG04G00274 [Camellia lanceoleosa]
MQNPSSSANPLRNDNSVSINRGIEHCVDNGVPLREDDDDVAIGDDLERVKSLRVDRCTSFQKKEADTADKDSLLAILVIHETISGLGTINTRGACIRNEALLSDCNCLNDDGRSPKVDGHVATSCFLKSLSGPPSSQPNVNLEVFLGPVQLDNFNHSRTQPIHALNKLGLVRSIEPINSGLQSPHVHNEVGLVRLVEAINSWLQSSHVHLPLLQSVEVNCRHSKLETEVSKAKGVRGNHHSAMKCPGKASRRVKAMALGGNLIKKAVLFLVLIFCCWLRKDWLRLTVDAAVLLLFCSVLLRSSIRHIAAVVLHTTAVV